MNLYEKVFKSEYLPSIIEKGKNDKQIEQCLTNHKNKFYETIYDPFNKDFLQTIKKAKRKGIKKFHEKPGGIYVKMFKFVM